MISPAQSVQRDSVSPLELFFDLVLIFAVWQLFHHLLVVAGGLSWLLAAWAGLTAVLIDVADLSVRALPEAT